MSAPRALLAGVVGIVLSALWGLGWDLEPVAVGHAAEPALSAGSSASEPPSSPGAGTVPRRYVVVDRANNRLYLRDRGSVVLEAVVSTGSGAVLRESGGERRTWTFDTPPGRFTIRAERPNPVWTRPDWAFLEEGRDPPARLSERREHGVLGEWALDLGDGYMIHGTLYERLLGRSVTHGCIRVGRDDLRVLAAAVAPGTPVFIF